MAPNMTKTNIKRHICRFFHRLGKNRSQKGILKSEMGIGQYERDKKI